MGNTRNTGYLQNLVVYDTSGNILLPANLTVTGSLLANGGGSYATQSYVTTQISNLVNGAPGLLDTLDELAAALGDDANFAATLTTSLSSKQASLSGTGFVKISGTTISYDNSTYLTTSSAASTYLPLAGGTLTGLLLGTSSTFSGIITANSQTTAANGSINIESSDPSVRFRVTGGTANNRIYEWRSAAAGGVNNFMELRLWNDAQSSATTLFSVTSAGAGTFLTSVNATKFVSNITNGYGLVLNRPATTNYNGISYQTVNSAQWFVGMRENGTNNYIVYNENGTDALIISKANSNVGIRTNTPYSPLTITGANISWGETMTIYPATSGYTTLAFRLEGADTTTGTWAFGKQSTQEDGGVQYLQFAKNGLSGGALHRSDAVQTFDPSTGNALFGFKVGIGTINAVAPLTVVSGGATGVLLETDKNNSGVSARLVARYSGGTGTVRYDSGGWRFNTGATLDSTSGTERALITQDGYFRMLSGTGGIQFQGTTGSSSALNYYEEGSWTPQLFWSAGGQYSMNSSNAGRYVRVGNLVHLQFQLMWGSFSGSYGGTLRVGGIPFTSGSSCRSAGVICANNSIVLNSGYTWLAMTIDPNNSSIYIIENAPAGGYTHSPIVNSSGIVYSLTITYSTT